MTSSPPLQLLWYKRDLRLVDHEPLAAASRAGAVLPMYVHEPALIGAPDYAAQHSGFVRECLDDLVEQLRARGGHLLEQIGDPVDVFEALWRKTSFVAIWAYRETTGELAFQRDVRVHAWARARGVTFHEIPQNGVLRGAERRHQRFDFRAHIESLDGGALAQPAENLAFAAPPVGSCDRRAVPVGRGVDKPARQRGGRPAAEVILKGFFVRERLLSYPDSISSPLSAEEGCSRLSPYLAHGVVSVKELVHRMSAVAQEAEDAGDPRLLERMVRCLRFFNERMYWRSAYLQGLEAHPDLERTLQHAQMAGLRETELTEFTQPWFNAWCEGRTGVPMIDAAMRCLRHHGWINMRARGMLISFAVNELWLHWREPGLFLAREFLDYEPGIHWSQMQIHGGTAGMDPLTYNPVKQAQDHDPRGTFARRWLPELEKLPPELLAEPWKNQKALAAHGVVLGRDYPAPLVNIAAANDAARVLVSARRHGHPEPKLAYTRERLKHQQNLVQGSLFG